MNESTRPPLSVRLRQLMQMDVADIASLPAMKRYALNFLRFCYRVAQRFVEDRCIQRASALAFATLLAIIPLVALGFSVFTTFQAFEQMAEKIRNLLLQYLLPTSQEVIQSYLSGVADKTTALSIFGIIGLLVTASALINTAEEAFNDIWRIRRKRAWLSKFMAFWATFSLAPVLIGASLTITSYFTALPLVRDVTAGAAILAKVPYVLPWLLSSLALACMYVVLPNTRVPFRYTVVGGLFAGALFELSKFGFAFYVTELAHYERVYGVLGTLPLFLIWLYLVWVVVLTGAEVAFCLQHPEPSVREMEHYSSPGVQAFFWHLLLLRAAQAQQRGEILQLEPVLEESGAPRDMLLNWLDELCAKNLLRPINADSVDGWLPAKESGQLRLLEIHQASTPDGMDIPDPWRHKALGRMLAGLYYRLDRECHSVLGDVTLNELMQAEAAEDK